MQRYRQAKVIIACIMLAMFAGSSLAGNAVRPQRRVSDEERFAADAKKAINALANEDYRGFTHYISSQGVIVVRREVDWDRTNKSIRESTEGWTPDAKRAFLSLAGQEPLVWTEDELGYHSTAIRGDEFKGILSQFQGFIRDSRAYFQGESYSLQMIDHWQSRHLGPAVEGKLVSNVFWYIYFVKEDGAWRVWRMEHVTH